MTMKHLSHLALLLLHTPSKLKQRLVTQPDAAPPARNVFCSCSIPNRVDA